MKAECLLIVIGFPCCNQACLPDMRAHLMRKKTRYKCQELRIMAWLKEKKRMSQSWLENEILRGNAFDEKSGDPMVKHSFITHVYL